jgi:hypothetical protein
MPGGQNLPVEIGVLNLVLAEIVLPVSRTGEKKQNEYYEIQPLHHL